MPIRILQILPKLEMGGVENGTIDTALIIKKNKMIPYVASSGGIKVKELEDNNIQHFQFWLNSKNPIIILLNSLILAIIIYLKKINIVHARSRAPAWSAWIACNLTGATYVTTFHGQYSGYNKFFKKQYNKIMTFGKKVVVPSNFMKKHLIKYYGVKSENIVSIYRGINTESFLNVNSERINNLKLRYNIDNQFVISFPGRLSEIKGQNIFLDAIKLIKKKNIKYLIIGNGSIKIKNKLDNIIKKNDLSVIIDTNCDDIPALYQISDIILSIPNVEETFGRVAVEGQAAGKVVITTALGGFLETVIDNKTGFLIPPNDSKALAEKINEVIDNNINFKDKAIKNSKKFDLKMFEKNIISFYKSL